MKKKEKKTKTIKFSIIISLFLSISIIILILYFTIDTKTFEYLSIHTVRYEFFFAAIIINIIYWVLWGTRLRILCNKINKESNISLLESTKIVITSLFLANITPSMAGGEPVRIYLLNKKGLSFGSATASVLGERLLDAIFLIFCFPLAFIVFRGYIETGPLSFGLTIALIVFVIIMILFIYALKNPEKTKSFLIFLNDKISRLLKRKNNKSEIVKRINKEVNDFHKSVKFFLSEGKPEFIKAGILTVVFWITGWMTPVLILIGLGLKPNLIDVFAAQILLIIIIMVPTTPGGAGVTEGGVAALYNVFIDSSLVGIFVLFYRLITYHIGLIVGAIFQYKIFKSLASFSLETIQKRN